MARISAIDLRTAARNVVLDAGGRGFVRFLPPGGALLATDANRRCAGEREKAALIAALESAGFICEEQNGLLSISPGDDWLGEIMYDGERIVDWDSPFHSVQALGIRWLDKQKKNLTDAGRQLILEVLRLTWQTPEQVKGGIESLRARGAAMQRMGDTSGMNEAGGILLNWCKASRGGNDDEA